ncbi:MAG: hypothetical protein D6719_07320 [Candidatus Dadabacteria bacterium]|nr:MAG: hypothetical protein D6719_07320 [Candidatus Dadabacteria bacterium]
MTISDETRAFIEREEQILRETLAKLEDQLQYQSRREARESKRARDLTSRLVAASRDEDKQMIASDEAVSHQLLGAQRSEIKRINKLLKKPYFARIVLSENRDGREVKIEYKVGYKANPDCRIIDWRTAPLSKLYYEYAEGDEYCEVVQGLLREGRVELRNTLEIKDQELVGIACRYGKFRKVEGKWQMVEDRIGGRHRVGELPDVLSLITPEQFKAITEEANSAVLIQGVAGSGKTTVALYRLAWLLHEKQDELKADDAIIIVKSRPLKLYIENSLGSLNLTGVKVVTFNEWMNNALKLIAGDSDLETSTELEDEPRSIKRLKTSSALLNAFKEHIITEKLQVVSAMEALDWKSLPQGMKKLFENLKLSNAPVLQIIIELQDATGRAQQAVNPASSFAGALVRFKEELKRIRALLPGYPEFIGNLLAREELILSNDQTRLINRELVRDGREYTLGRYAEGKLSKSDAVLTVLLYQLRSGGAITPGGKPGNYAAMVIDEVQDFSSAALAVMANAVRSPNLLTLAGDIEQQIGDGAAFPGWQALQQQWFSNEQQASYVKLTVSHRSTVQIMRFADYIRGRTQQRSGRKGRPPIWFRCYSENSGVRSVIEWLEKALERYPHDLTAVLCRDIQTAKFALSLLKPRFGPLVRLGDDDSFSFEEGIVVSAIKQVKGLEFTNVLIWNPSGKFYDGSRISRNMLYVAATRAEDNLCIVTWGRPSPLLPAGDSGLVRLCALDDQEEGSYA